MQIVTDRLCIRLAKDCDVDAVLLFRNSEFVLKYNCMHKCTRDELYQELVREDSFVMVLNQQVIGVIDLHEDSLRYRIASKELSYYLDEAYTKQGYMKEALGAIINYLFRVEKLECVSARAFVENIASHKLLLSLGMHQDGVLPKAVKGYNDIVYDDGLYSILKEEYGYENL